MISIPGTCVTAINRIPSSRISLIIANFRAIGSTENTPHRTCLPGVILWQLRRQYKQTFQILKYLEIFSKSLLTKPGRAGFLREENVLLVHVSK